MPCVCSKPFTYFQIEFDGDCFFCCPMFTDYPIGNIFKNSFEDIWYGEKATKFRESILDGSHKFCKMDICTEASLVDEKDIKLGLPKEVHLSYVKACNLRCITCRDKLIYESKENTEYFDSYIDKILPFCKEAETVYLNGSGELFVSRHLCKLCRKIVEVNPKVKFFVHSNGMFLNKEMCEKFGFLDNIREVSVSVHAATEKNIRRNSSWWKMESTIEKFGMAFNIEKIW